MIVAVMSAAPQTGVLQNPISDFACQVIPGAAGMCAAKEVAGAAGGAAKSAVGSGVWQTIVDGLNSSVGAGIRWCAGLFTVVGSGIDGSTAGIDSMRAALVYAAAVVAIASIIIVGAKMALSRNARPAMGVGRGLAIMIFTGGCSVAVYSLLSAFATAFGGWAVRSAGVTDAQLGKAVTNTIGAMGAGGVGFAFLFALLFLLVSLGLIVSSVFRSAIAILSLTFLPVLAGATIMDAGLIPFKKVCGWLGACALWPGVAGVAFATSLVTFTKATDGRAICEALALLMLACGALPALMKIMCPVMSAIGNSGSGAALAVGGALAATGARLVASRHSSNSSSSNSSQSASGAPTAPSGASQAPSGAAPVGGNAYAGPKSPPGASSTGGGAAGGAGGAVVQGAVNLAKKVKSHANSEATPEGAKR